MYDKKNKASIQSLFNNISEDYDLLNNIMSLGLHSFIKSLAVKNIPSQNPERILDLCTGTGDIAIKLHKKYKNAEVVGVDFSEKMIQIAKRKIKDSKNITIKKMDITNMDFEPESFDLCFISFGLRNLEDIDKSLSDIKKVLKLGGILSILDLGKPNKFVAFFYNVYFNRLIPIIGGIFHKESTPYKYLVESVKTYPTQEELIKILEKHGFNKCKNINYSFGIMAQQIAYK